MDEEAASKPASEIADIRGPVEIIDFTAWYIAGGLMLLALIAAGLFIWWFATRKAQVAKQAMKAELSPYLLAQCELEDARQRMREHDDKAFTAAVSNAVRNYLERAFALPAPKLTSEEFFAMVQHQAKLPRSLLESLQPFLEMCDLVKFAAQALDDASREDLLQTAETFINQAHDIEKALIEKTAKTARAPQKAQKQT